MENKFEYTIRDWCYMPTDEVSWMNKMGADGWGLRGVRGDRFYFARPVRETISIRIPLKMEVPVSR
jgi:hypothetical protein